MRTPRAIGWGLLALAAGLAANSLLGPLVFGVVHYRYGPSMTNQGIGLDAAVLGGAGCSARPQPGHHRAALSGRS
jgi:hypothetical protein